MSSFWLNIHHRPESDPLGYTQQSRSVRNLSNYFLNGSTATEKLLKTWRMLLKLEGLYINKIKINKDYGFIQPSHQKTLWLIYHTSKSNCHRKTWLSVKTCICLLLLPWHHIQQRRPLWFSLSNYASWDHILTLGLTAFLVGNGRWCEHELRLRLGEDLRWDWWAVNQYLLCFFKLKSECLWVRWWMYFCICVIYNKSMAL